MKPRAVLSERHYQGQLESGRDWAYVVRTELVEGPEAGGECFKMRVAYTEAGDYVGDPKTARMLIAKRGIKPEKAQPGHSVCSIGFNEAEQKWYGWSHRAMFGFGVGDVVSEGDCCASSGWTEEYLAEHPEEDTSLPVGFEAETLGDAKRMAVAFAESVS